MTVKLLYFAGVREALGRSTETIELPPDVHSIGALRCHFGARGAPWSMLADDRGWRFAVNRAVAGSAEVTLKDGDEIAVFPPVTGG